MFLILKDYVFNLNEIQNAYSGRDGETKINYKDGTTHSYPFLKFSDFIKAIENSQRINTRGEKDV